MPATGAARRESYAPPHLTPSADPVSLAAPRASVLAALCWAVMTSTTHRVRRGEGALLAVNLSLIVHQGGELGRSVLLAVVSTLAILVMYAFNDLYDAPGDWNNPKKDRRLIATWVAHRRAGVLVTFALKAATLAFALVALGPRVATAIAAVMVVNVVYSTRLKGVPVADVAAVWLWGLVYAAIVSSDVRLVFLVGLMTAVCHLFQALDDREPDAANGIETTAVRSATLARDVLLVLTLLLAATVWAPLGPLGAVSAGVPLAIFFVVRNAGAGWLLTKAYFAVVWLLVLAVG